MLILHKGLILRAAASFYLLLLPCIQGTITGSQRGLTFCDGIPDGLYADPDRCDYFWKCWDNGLQGIRFLCPPNTVWNQDFLKCDLPGNVQSGISPSRAPIWGWNGILFCYGRGCSSIGHSWDIGIPCVDGQELVAVARNSTNAWVSAPHEATVLGSQHWRINFDSVNTSESGTTLIHASVVDYNPSQRILSSWQGGPGGGRFVIQGPLKSTQGCYYSINHEEPQIWKQFASALLGESKRDQGRARRLLSESQGETLVVSKKRNKRRKTRPRKKTISGCLERLPWTSIVSTALCSAMYAGASTGPCRGFSSYDLLSIADCLEVFQNP